MAGPDDQGAAQGPETGTPPVGGAAGRTTNGNSSDNTPSEPKGEPQPRQKTTMEDWYTEARRSRAGNQMAATRYQGLGRGSGALSAALTAFVGGSLFTTLSANETNNALQITTATISVVAALLAVVITSLGFLAKSVQHQQASVMFGVIVHDLEALYASDDTNDGWTGKLDEVKKDLNKAVSASPILPGRFFNKGQRWVEKHSRTLADGWLKPTKVEDDPPGLLQWLFRPFRPNH